MAKENSTLKSMTGFGMSSFTLKSGRFDIEIQSVNRRHLEVDISLPKSFAMLEPELRSWVSARVGRGQVGLTLYWKKHGEQAYSITANIALAQGLKKAWQEIAQALEIDQTVTLAMLSSEKELLVIDEKCEEDFKDTLYKALERAFDQFDALRKNEGARIADDFKNRLGVLQNGIENIEKQKTQAVEQYRAKLLQRLKEVFQQDVEEDPRILKEIALYAEKVDIEEEVVRFKSHLKQMQEKIEQPLQIAGEVKGKRLEFLLQELLRESNTIGAKTAQASISSLVIDIKCELERMREQVQNIE